MKGKKLIEDMINSMRESTFDESQKDELRNCIKGIKDNQYLCSVLHDEKSSRVEFKNNYEEWRRKHQNKARWGIFLRTAGTTVGGLFTFFTAVLLWSSFNIDENRTDEQKRTDWGMRYFIGLACLSSGYKTYSCARKLGKNITANKIYAPIKLSYRRNGR